MMYHEPNHDPEEAARVRRAILIRDREQIAALRGLTRRGSYERQFLTIDPSHHDGLDSALLKRLVWHYRASLPSALRPKVNPADPIVREQEAAHG
jgi:hypothetical protein